MSTKLLKSLAAIAFIFLSACAAPATQAPPVQTAASRPSAPESTPTPTEAQALAPVSIPSGIWEGTVTEPGLTYPIQLTFSDCSPGAACGTVDYENFACGGSFTLLETAETELTFEETIEYGVDQCFSGATVRMWAGAGEGERLLGWFGPDGSAGPTAEISKTGDLPTPTPAPTLVAVDGLGSEVFSYSTGQIVNYPPVAFQGSLWVPVMNAGQVLRIDMETGELLATIVTGKKVHDFCCSTNSLTAAAGSIWVTQGYEKEVVRIDPATNEVVERIQIGADAYDLVSDGESLWVTGFEDSVVVRIDLATSEVVAVIEDVLNPTGITVGGGAVWAVEHRKDYLVRIDPATNTIVLKIKLGDPDRELGRKLNSENAVFAFGSVWVALNWDSSVARIDPETNEQTRFFFPGMGVLRVSAGEDRIWLALYKIDGTDETTNKVGRIDPKTGSSTSWVLYGTNYVFEVDGMLWVLAGERGRPGDRIYRYTLED